MNCLEHHRIRLAARNEGKIKSFESCVDVRAWSHDIQIRDRYLRDWIKCDMPICVLPVCALASILTIMSCRSRGRVAPRRHLSGKSKIILDTVCSSCSVMKECLSNNKEFEKYFIEEELETIHWPCEKCLDILKSVKVFWKIVLEKVLKIHLPRTEKEVNTVKSSIRNVAKEWRQEIVHEAKFVKSSTVLFRRNECYEKNNNSINESQVYEEATRIPYQNKLTETECGVRSIASQKNDKFIRKKMSKCTSVNIKMEDRVTDACDQRNNEEIIFYKNNIENLQQQYSLQKRELDRLEKENMSLNFELQYIYQNRLNNSFNHGHSLTNIGNTGALAPVLFENESDEKIDWNPAKDIDSEMIICLKKCTDENYKNISMLQVLHKTNEKKMNITESCSCYKKEDPTHMLNKVHKIFGAIVSREISIANKTKNSKSKDVVIKTTFRNVGASTPTCSTSSYSITSGTNFESAKDTYDTPLTSDL